MQSDVIRKGECRMLVSIIMPTYNCAEFIAQSIDSVLAQTLTDWELQIVDDCSEDHTAQIIRDYQSRDSRIHYHCLGKNSGPAAARTEAIRYASGKYVAFLDSDDLWHPQKLEKQLAFMQRVGADFCATAYQQMRVDGTLLPTVCYPPEKMNYGYCIRHSNPIGNLTVIYNQEKLGKFEVPPIRKRNDFALWLRILQKTPYCYGLQDNLAVYRLGRTGSVSSNKLEQAKYHWQLYRRIEGHSFLRASFEMGCWAFVKGTGIGLKRVEEPIDS